MMKSFFRGKNKYASIIGLLLIITMILSIANPIATIAADYDAEYQINLNVNVSGVGEYTVKTIHLNYPDNTYVSLRDMAAALSGTKAQYNVSITKSGITMVTGKPYVIAGGENKPFSAMTRSQSAPEYVRKRNGFAINGYNTHYYTMIYETESGVYDCYMYLTDLALILDVDMEYQGSDLLINPEAPLKIDPVEMERDYFFGGINGAMVGDATTGEIFYSYHGDESAPMASTTKLMTYTVVMDAVSSGRISLSDKTAFSAEVQKLSYSPDYSFHLKEGDTATIEDLLYAMLLPSSNECALALAEAVSGTESAFVSKMNEKAQAIGMSEGTEFFNSNGLPHFTEEVFEAKIQNRTTPKDMFKLVCYIASVYPQITEITSCTGKMLPSLGRTVYNTNSMLFNMPGAVGLKTGTTNKAGCCLVSGIEVIKDGKKHLIVAVELGAEDMVSRNSISKALLTYGRNVASGQAPIAETDVSTKENAVPIEGIPNNPEDLARLIVWTARNYIETPEIDKIDIPEDTKGL